MEIMLTKIDKIELYDKRENMSADIKLETIQ